MTNNALVKRDESVDPLHGLSVLEVAKIALASRFYANSGIQSAEQAAMKVMVGMDLGIPVSMALSNISIIKGNPSIDAQAMGGLIKAHPDYDYVVREKTDKRCVIDFYVRIPLTGKVETIREEYTLEEAVKAKLTGKDNWKNYPKNMIFNRCLSNGAKAHCAGIFMGKVYVPEEMGVEVNEDGSPVNHAEFTPAPAPTEVVDVAPEPVPDEPIEDAAPPEEQPPPPPDDHVPPPEETGEEPPLPPQEVTYTHNYKQLHAKRRAAKLGTKELKEFGILKFKKDSAKLWTPDQFQMTLDWLDACEAAGEIINPNDFEG